MSRFDFDDESVGYGQYPRQISGPRGGGFRDTHDNSSGHNEGISMGPVKKVLNSWPSVTYCIPRGLTALCNAIMLSFNGLYLNALMTNHKAGKQPIVIVLVFVLSVAIFYHSIVLGLYFDPSRTGKRFKYFMVADILFAALVLGFTIKIMIEVAAMTCNQKQFTHNHLNRYGMGASNHIDTFQGWAKNSSTNCKETKVNWIFGIISTIFNIVTVVTTFTKERSYDHETSGNRKGSI